MLPCASLQPDCGHVTSLHADGSLLVAGTSAGMLLRFSLSGSTLSGSTGVDEVEPLAVAVCHKSARGDRGVRQLFVLGERGIVIALCDGLVSVHAVDTLEEV